MIANVVDPICNSLRHTKKTNLVKSKDNIRNFNGMNRPMNNQHKQALPVTNREMDVTKVGMNHLNVQQQDSTAYMNQRPVLNETQRQSMNTDQSGPAMSVNNLGNKSYANVYNQRNNNRIYASDVMNTGNMSLFNNNINMELVDREVNNHRPTPVYQPQNQGFLDNKSVLGQFTTMPKDGEASRTSNMMDVNMLSAFKNNPYTHSLSSVV